MTLRVGFGDYTPVFASLSFFYCHLVFRRRGSSPVAPGDYIYIFSGGKIADLMHAYSKQQNIQYAVFDMARCNDTKYFPWNFIENIKSGWYTSTKYDGGMYTFIAPKVIMFMNEEPPRNVFSKDRYQVINI